LPFASHAGKTSADCGASGAVVANRREFGGRNVETAQGASKKKRKMVNSYVYEDTKERLKVVAALKGMSLFDTMETILADYIRGWEKLHKVDLGKIWEVEGKPPRKSRSKS
jgi:hypothetical protein